MVTRLIKAAHAAPAEQLTLDLDPLMHERFGSLRECVAQGVYQRGLTNVAPTLDMAPGNLSVQLSEDPVRKFGVDSLERYIEQFGDVQPVLYLVSKFLRKPDQPVEAIDPEVLVIAKQIAAMKRGARA